MASLIQSRGHSRPFNSGADLRQKLSRKLIIRLAAICSFQCLTGYLVFNSPFWMAGIWTALVTVFIFINTIHLVNSSERKLTSFLQALRQNDFTITFAEDAKADGYDLHRAFNQLNAIYKDLRSERESQHLLLQVVVEQAGAPMICFEEGNGEVYLVNNAAKELLQIPFLQKIDSLSHFDLAKIAHEIKDGEKRSHKLILSGKIIFLSISSCHILFEDRNLKLITLQDVTSELAAKEAESWHKLLRVLTHEISNSAIPLSTLSSYIQEVMLKAYEDHKELTPDQRQDVMMSLKTIDQRSRTLKEFVHNFRMVGQVPEPMLVMLNAKEIVEIAEVCSNWFTS